MEHNGMLSEPRRGAIYVELNTWIDYFDGLVQERRNSIALAMELRLSWPNPSIYCWLYFIRQYQDYCML